RRQTSMTINSHTFHRSVKHLWERPRVTHSVLKLRLESRHTKYSKYNRNIQKEPDIRRFFFVDCKKPISRYYVTIMFWADKIADEVVRRYASVIDAGKPIVIRDEKTASGKVHVGSLRSAALHAIVADVLRSRGIPVAFHFEINDFDAMDGIPSYLDEETYMQYMGMPLYRIPSPEP